MKNPSVALEFEWGSLLHYPETEIAILVPLEGECQTFQREELDRLRDFLNAVHPIKPEKSPLKDFAYWLLLLIGGTAIMMFPDLLAWVFG